MLPRHMAGAVNLINLGDQDRLHRENPAAPGRALPGSPPERLKTDKHTSNTQMVLLRTGLRVSPWDWVSTRKKARESKFIHATSVMVVM